MENDTQGEGLRPTGSNPDEFLATIRAEKESTDNERPDIWHELETLKKRGQFMGEIDIIKTKKYKLNKGEHYFVIENNSTRSIKCISCPISHGGVLEAHLLSRYTLENGVLSFDGRPTNTIPKGFDPALVD